MHDRSALKTQWNSITVNGETREVTKGGAAVLPVAASISPRLALLEGACKRRSSYSYPFCWISVKE